MNVKFNAALMSVALLTGTAFTSVASAKDGEINFKGEITDAGCTVTPTTATQDKDLGVISSKNFTAVGDTGSSVTIGIVLTSCPATFKNVSARFDGKIDETNTNLLEITDETDKAEGVAIGLYEADGTTLIPLGSDSASQPLAASGDTTLTYVAKYMATKVPVKMGPANGVANFTIVYK